MHKIFLFIFFLTLLNSKLLPQNFWEEIDSPTSKTLNSIIFIDSLNGWVSGDSGLIIHTSNGGIDWEKQYSNDSLNMVNIFFLNDRLGWAAASSQFYAPYGTYILKTTNGGINWTSDYFRIGEAYINSLYFLDSLTGFAVGYPQVFHRTTDGGISWTRVNLDSSIAASYPPYSIKFYSPQYGYACGGVRDIKGVVWRTTNGGLNWKTVVDTMTFETLFDLHIFDSLHVIVMGGDPEYGTSQVVTTDGGENWEYTALGVFYFPFSIGFRNDIEGWVPMGEQRKFLYSSNSGENWTEITTPDSADVLRICFPDSSHGFGVGRNGTIVKYLYRGPTNMVEEEESIPYFYLFQNYPNPFNPTTNINFRISELGIVTLIVYDVLGNEISTLVNGEKSEGNYSVTFDGSGLPSGVYFYTLKASTTKEKAFFTSKKMLILK
jgi:photosystem II stability/assembly factor-like uncharacterized protein